jgi:hypothetical protein
MGGSIYGISLLASHFNKKILGVGLELTLGGAIVNKSQTPSSVILAVLRGLQPAPKGFGRSDKAGASAAMVLVGQRGLLVGTLPRECGSLSSGTRSMVRGMLSHSHCGGVIAAILRTPLSDILACPCNGLQGPDGGFLDQTTPLWRRNQWLGLVLPC